MGHLDRDTMKAFVTLAISTLLAAAASAFSLDRLFGQVDTAAAAGLETVESNVRVYKRDLDQALAVGMDGAFSADRIKRDAEPDTDSDSGSDSESDSDSEADNAPDAPTTNPEIPAENFGF